MQFSSFQEFIEMGGYAFNVWSVYGMFIIFLAINLYGPLRKNKQIIRDLKRRYAINSQVQPMSVGSDTYSPRGSEVSEEDRA
ncbi:MAG: heme exporter protein CcmD [Gammaproteobacteria bacterium]|nr:heme exporter protein CcmD [Gammaproteobacteria bacterium]